MPERNRLANTLWLPVSLRSDEGKQALRDLIALYTQDSKVAYHLSMWPKNGFCPLPGCALNMNRFVIHLTLEL